MRLLLSIERKAFYIQFLGWW